MAYESGVEFTAQDFIDLKARVKAEMTRRKGTGSLASYAGADYDYITTPTTNGEILPEHINKIITPLSKINYNGLSTQAQGDTVKAMAEINTVLSNYEKADLTGTGHYCNSSCSGMCSTGCYSECSGCTGTCSGTCSNTCTGSCSGSCSGCSGSCSESCAGSCWHSCGSYCSSGNSCGGGCTATCASGCGTYCGDTCSSTVG